MTTMESLIGLVNRIQRACTVLGDYGGGDNTFSSLWEALPSVAVVGGQVFKTALIAFESPIVKIIIIILNFVLFWLRSEFWKVVGFGEHCGARFSSKGIRFGDFCFGFYMSLTFCFVLFLWRLSEGDYGDLQVLWRGGLWCCSCTRQRVDNRSMQNSFTCQKGDLLILVCILHFSLFICDESISFTVVLFIYGNLVFNN